MKRLFLILFLLVLLGLPSRASTIIFSLRDWALSGNAAGTNSVRFTPVVGPYSDGTFINHGLPFLLSTTTGFITNAFVPGPWKLEIIDGAKFPYNQPLYFTSFDDSATYAFLDVWQSGGNAFISVSRPGPPGPPGAGVASVTQGNGIQSITNSATNLTLQIDPFVVPQLASPNVWSGSSNTFTGPVRVGGASPAISLNNDGSASFAAGNVTVSSAGQLIPKTMQIGSLVTNAINSKTIGSSSFTKSSVANPASTIDGFGDAAFQGTLAVGIPNTFGFPAGATLGGSGSGSGVVGTATGPFQVDSGGNIRIANTNSPAQPLALNNDGSAKFAANAVSIDASGNITGLSFTGSASGLTSIPAAHLTGSLPAISGASLTSLTADNLTGTLPNGVFPATLPAASGVNLTSLPAANLTGTVSDGALSGNVVLESGTQTITGAKTMNATGNAFTGSFTGNGASLTNVDIGTTSANDFASITPALNQWTNRGGQLYLPNGAYSLSTPFVFSAFADVTPDSLGGMSIRGNAFGSSILRWAGANGAMFSYSGGVGAKDAINMEDIELLDSAAATGTNAGYVQQSITAGGVGPIFWKNVALENWNVGAVIYNSVGFFYGLNLNGCGIGMYYPTLSDGQVIHVRSIGNTNASIVTESRGHQIYYNAAADKFGVVIGGGGGDFIQLSAEQVTNSCVAIGYPPTSVLPNEGLNFTSHAIIANQVGYGYVLNGQPGAAVVTLWEPSMGLQMVDETIGINGVVSETNTADTTPMTFDGVTCTSGSPLVTFSDATTIPTPVVGVHYGVNVADSEYNLSHLVYSRDTNGVVLDSQTIGTNDNASISGASASYAVNLGVAYHTLTVGTNMTFTVTGTNLLSTTNGLKVDLILTTQTNYTLVWPANWQWENETTNALAPATIAANTHMHVELTVAGGNFYAHALVNTNALDPDAVIFLNLLAGACTLTETNAINQYVIDLKTDQIWTNIFDGLYPEVGGTSNSCKFSLVFPSNNQITWHIPNSFTFDHTGVTGNGSTTYGDTGFVPSTATTPNYTQNSASVWTYSKTASFNSSSSILGAWTGPSGVNPRVTLTFNGASLGMSGAVNAGNPNGTTANGGTTGLLGISRTGATTITYYNNSTANGDNTTATGVPNSSITLFADNGFPVENFAAFKSVLFAFGGGMNSTQQARFLADTVKFETALGRQ